MSLFDRHLFGAHPTVLGAAASDMNACFGCVVTRRLQDVDRAFYVDAHGVNRRIPRFAGVALGRQVVDPVGLSCLNRFGDRKGIFDVALVEGDPPIEMLDRAGVAAPALKAVHLDAGNGQQVVGERAADRPCDASDQNTHRYSSCLCLFLRNGLNYTRRSMPVCLG